MTTDDLLFLSFIPRVGRGTLRKLLGCSLHFDRRDHQAIVEGFRTLREMDKKVPLPTLTDLDYAEFGYAEAELKSSRLGIRALSVLDVSFPDRLRAIPNPPVLLFVKGEAQALSNQLAVAIVGTREVSIRGFRAGERLGRVFAEKGAVVVSGLAKGSDTAAHLGCVEASGTAAAVLAGGLDKVYPKENTRLAERIIEYGGALVSEYAVGVAPQKNYFVERDRLQSGLSDAVIVLETGRTGGTMHTVGFCKEQNRLLACLDPERVGLDSSAKVDGNRYILDELGGYPIGGAADIDEMISRALMGRPMRGVQPF